MICRLKWYSQKTCQIRLEHSPKLKLHSPLCNQNLRKNSRETKETKTKAIFTKGLVCYLSRICWRCSHPSPLECIPLAWPVLGAVPPSFRHCARSQPSKLWTTTFMCSSARHYPFLARSVASPVNGWSNLKAYLSSCIRCSITWVSLRWAISFHIGSVWVDLRGTSHDRRIGVTTPPMQTAPFALFLLLDNAHPL